MKPDEQFIKHISNYIYNIAIRMLWHPEDAEDATQDILIKVLNNIDSFREESKIETWVYRIAVNHLVDFKQKRFKDQEISFDEFAADVNVNYPEMPTTIDDAEIKIYIEELKVGCTHALLQCLDKKHRMIFILSCIFNINSTSGADIMEMEPANYRKKLSRARKKILSFMKSNCGLYNPEAKCSCKRRLPIALEKNRVNKNAILFANKTSATIQDYVDTMNELDEVSRIYQSGPGFKLNNKFFDSLKTQLNGNAADIFRVE
ncbi:MAG: RNA polymerase sigma factor [bacterium]|nr:RNA polymerase sigma factor [bacterium]